MTISKRDYYYNKAKIEGYRSRASYKLIQINNKEHIIKKKDNIVDLGAAPGGWLQVSRELSNGIIVGIDIQEIKNLNNVITIKEDIRNTEITNNILKLCNNKVDVVLCDAAQNLSGNWTLDHGRGIELNEYALECTKKILKKEGNFVVKVFQGDLFINYYNKLKNLFKYVKSYSPLASRSTSSEIYVICKRYLKIPIQKNKVYNVEIEKIGKNGDGIAFIENFIIFVKKSFINQKVSVLIEDIKMNYAFGIIVNNDFLYAKNEEDLNNVKTLSENYVIELDEEDEYENAF